MKLNAFALILCCLVASLAFGICKRVSGQSETIVAAAKKAFDQGEAERATGNFNGAISLYKTAIRITPENALYQNRIGRAYLDAEKYDAMWVHFRKAANLNPGNEEFATDFLKIWRYHDLQGTLNVSTPAAIVLQNLGEPEKRIENDSMKRWVYGFIAVDFGQDQVFRTIDLRGYTAEAAAQPEQVKVQSDPKAWKVSHHVLSRTDDNLELTRHDETVQNWTELFSKQRFPLMSQTNATVKGMSKTMETSLKQNGLLQFEVLSETPTSILYHWRTKTTANNAAQHEIAKIMKGRKDFYRVSYVKKTEKLDDAEFSKWTGVIGNAELIPSQNSVAASTESPSPRQASSSNTRRASWDLGKNLGFAALFRGRHGPEETVKQTLMHVSRRAKELGVEIPAPGRLTDSVAEDTAAAIHFLLETAGKPVYNSLEEKHGGESAALFELGIKSTLLLMMYQPGDSSNDSFTSAIERSATKAKVDPAVWKTLVAKVNSKASVEEIRKSIMSFHKQMSSSNPQQKSHANQPKPTTRKRKTTPKSNSTIESGMSQIIELNGSKVAEVTADGEIWVGGVKAGELTSDGEIWVAGDKEGDLTADGEVWKAGNKIGDVTTKGRVWRDGNEVGTVETDGSIWIGSSRAGSFRGGKPMQAAAIVFFDFFEIEN